VRSVLVKLLVMKFELTKIDKFIGVTVILGFYAKTKYSSHVYPGLFITHTRTKSVHIKPNIINKVYLLHK
jgi:hypothetical protein